MKPLFIELVGVKLLYLSVTVELYPVMRSLTTYVLVSPIITHSETIQERA